MPGSTIDDQLQELQHFAALGRVSASLIHEISNPLTAALLHLETDSQQLPGIRQAQHNLHLLWRYVEAARQQVRKQSTTSNFAVQPQIDQLERIVRPLARQAGVQLKLGPVPDCTLYGDPVKLQQIVTNLIVNAIEAYSGKQGLNSARLVSVTMTQRQDWLIIRVTDRGQGITAANLPRLFEAFYSTKNQTGQGLGLGLATVKHYITADFGGSIKASSSNKSGTTFTARLRTQSRSASRITLSGLIFVKILTLLIVSDLL